MNDVHCPSCSSSRVIKKGRRTTCFEKVQLYRCNSCGKHFAKRPMKYVSYPPLVIYTSLIFYHLGHTLDETRKQVNKQFKVNTGKTTIYSWVKRYQDLCPISRLRERMLDEGTADDVVFTKQFDHENLEYLFLYHKYKLGALASQRFPGLAEYIIRFENGCPDAFFKFGERCSQPLFQVNVKPRSGVNLACKMARFAVSARRNNRERHRLVEWFMLVNDTATVACEVPVWYWEKSSDTGVTGHIDVVQVRGDTLYIMDYKPDASNEKKAPQQLYHYAVALSFRTKIPFERIRCAWFDETRYYEFRPLDAEVKLIRRHRLNKS